MRRGCLCGGEGTPVTSGGVEALLSNGDQVVGVDRLHVDRHLLHPLLKCKSTSRAAESKVRVRQLSSERYSRCFNARHLYAALDWRESVSTCQCSG